VSRAVRTVATNAAWLAVGETLLKGALFLAAALVARGMGPAGMGAFTVAYGAALVLTQLLAAGQVEVVIRETAAEPFSGRRLFQAARRIQARVAWLLAPPAAAAGWWLGGETYGPALLAFLPYAVLRTRLITAAAVFKGLDRMDVEVKYRGLEVAVALVGLGAAVALKLPVWTAGVAFTLGAAVGSAAAVHRVRRLAGGGAAAERTMWSEGLPFVGLAATSQLLGRMDVFVLAGFGVAAAAVGHYGAAATPVWGLVAVAQLVAVAVYPTLSRAALAGGLGGRHALALGVGGGVLGTVLAAGLVMVRRPLVALVFGSAYDAAMELLAVMAWALPGACGAMVLGVMVAALRRQGWALASQSVLLLGAAGAYLAVVPRWGVAGCAMALVAVHLTGFLAALACAWAAARWPGSARVEKVAV